MALQTGVVPAHLTVQGSSSCEHDSDFFLFSQDDHLPQGCGLCFLILLWEHEIPQRLHAYKLLAENGKPELSNQFRRHLEMSLGLKGPEPNQPLRAYRTTRGQLYRKPPKNAFPVAHAIWEMMGYQPKLAQPLLRALCGQNTVSIAVELKMTPFGVTQAIAKGTRFALRIIRN